MNRSVDSLQIDKLRGEALEQFFEAILQLENKEECIDSNDFTCQPLSRLRKRWLSSRFRPYGKRKISGQMVQRYLFEPFSFIKTSFLFSYKPKICYNK